MFKIFEGKEIESELEKIKSRPLFDKEKLKLVERIVEDVKGRKDEALIEYTEKYDNIKLSKDGIKVNGEEISNAVNKAGTEFANTIKKLAANIEDFHKKQKEDEWFEQLKSDAVLGMRNIPLDSAGIYVPGGRASYPSSVLMNAIPALVAGVKRIVMVSPPPVSPYVLAAAATLGITEIYKVGGAQAIAALAYGTETIQRVDKIVGPGNAYVTAAKKLVSFDVGIDSLAGPSDIVIIADSDAHAEYIAADLLSQCEHDPDAQAIFITDSKEKIKEVMAQVETQIKKLKRAGVILESIEKNGRIFLVSKLKDAAPIVNIIAPEHLEILTSPPQKKLEDIKNAGAVFLGPYSPVALGDYGAGPNHVLPTMGTARFSSPLGVYDFIKRQSVLGYTKQALNEIKKDIAYLAELEGLDAHKRAIEIRFS